MQTYIPTEDKFKQILSETVHELLEDSLPEILRRAKRKEWMTSEDVKEFLGVNDRQLQYLRDTRQIPFSQTGSRTIFYPTRELEQWMIENMPEGEWKERRKQVDEKYAA